MTKKETKQKKFSDKDIVPVVNAGKLSIKITNFDDVKKEVENIAKAYEGYEVTEETLGDDKKTRAKLRKAAKIINDKRIEIKKKVLKPVDAFEDSMKELAELMLKPSNKIDEQIKEYDEKRKQEKIELAESIIAERKAKSELPDKYLERIEIKDSFSNLSTSQTSIESDLDEQLEILEKEYNAEQENIKVIESTVENVNKEIEGNIYAEDFAALLETQSISEVIIKINERKKTILEKEKEPIEETKNDEAVDEEPPKEETTEETKDDEEVINVDLKVAGTAKQLAGLKSYLVSSELEYKLNQ